MTAILDELLVGTCNFCGKEADEVEKVIVGSDVYICNECIDLCNDIIQEEKREPIKDHNCNCELCTHKEI